MNIERDFQNAMHEANVPTDAPIFADGVLHRVHVLGDKPRTVNGWYRLHADGVPAGAFGHWNKGISQTWRAGATTPTSRNRSAEIEAQREARAAEQERSYSAAAKRAVSIHQAATLDAAAHPYIVRKNIQTFGVFQNDDDVLVIPIYDARNGTLQTIQFIGSEGQKRFLSGSRTAYGCFPLRHTHESFKRAVAVRIGLGEGYATTATLAHVLGPTVAMFSAFSASNLVNVAIAVREQYANAEITIYSDNDQNEVGQTAAIKAAIAANGFVAIPPVVGTDWNDALRAAA